MLYKGLSYFQNKVGMIDLCSFSPSTSIEPTVTPSIVLNTQIEDIETGLKRQSAIVGEPLIWEIEGPGKSSIL